MTKRVKEILKELKSKEYNILLDELQDLEEAYEKELSEKDRKIDKYINNEAILNSNIMGFMDYIKKLKQQQLII